MACFLSLAVYSSVVWDSARAEDDGLPVAILEDERVAGRSTCLYLQTSEFSLPAFSHEQNGS